jgi:hypothetical protein
MVGDMTTWLRAASAGHAFYYLNDPLAVIRIHRDQLSWSEHGLPTRNIATLRAFRFDDPACEQLRRARLGECFLARAHFHIRAGRLRAARADLSRARKAAPELAGLRAALALSGLRALIMRWGSSRSRLLAPVLEFWPRVRPAVVSRGR